MSEFRAVAQRCFSESSSILREIRSELNNWNDSRSVSVKEYVGNSRKSFQLVCDAAGNVDTDIQKMREIADKVTKIAEKEVGNDKF